VILPSDRSTRHVLAVIAVSAFLGSITGSSIPIALPVIGADLHVGIGETSLVMLSYFLGAAVLMVIAGRLGDWLGHRLVNNAGALLLAAGGAVAALAPDLPTLVFGRLVQGISGAFLMAVAPALLTAAVPPDRRGRSFGLLSTATYLGLTLGPPLGGALIHALGWRALFGAMSAVGLLLFGMGHAWLPHPPARATRFTDLPGALVMVLGFPFVIVAVSRGYAWGWTSPLTLGVLLTGLASFVLFVVLEARRDDALVDLRLFRDRAFAGSAVAALFNYVAIFISSLLLSYFLQESLGLAPSRAGLVLSTQPIVMAVVAYQAGKLSDRIGTRGLAVGGMLVLAAGLLGMSFVDAASSPLAVGAWYALCGLGIGTFISPNTATLMGSAPRHQQGVAGGIMSLARTFGMLLGIAAGTTLFEMAGGRTGHAWGPTELWALHLALRIAAVHALLSALASALRGTKRAAIP
jgi:EmrB/QacA subfamily drug resistance transporter